MKQNNFNIEIWLCVNKNGKVTLFSGENNEPIRNAITGKWNSKYPYINSIIYPQMQDLAKQAELTWNSEPEYLQISF